MEFGDSKLSAEFVFNKTNIKGTRDCGELGGESFSLIFPNLNLCDIRSI